MAAVETQVDPATLAQITGRDSSYVSEMLVDRLGESDGSNMTAFGLHALLGTGDTYSVSATTGFGPARGGQPRELGPGRLKDQSTPPPHVVVEGRWHTEATVGGGSANALGDFTLLELDTSDTTVQVPVIEATDEALGFYKATVVADGDDVHWADTDFPIWRMSVGPQYVEDYLMTPAGQGFYLEYHNDAPHWHQPISTDASGFYLLAKSLGQQRYAVTGFSIPYGKAVYTEPGVIHCDAAVVGSDWLVGYTDARDFSTALVRNDSNAMIRFVPVEAG